MQAFPQLTSAVNAARRTREHIAQSILMHSYHSNTKSQKYAENGIDK